MDQDDFLVEERNDIVLSAIKQRISVCDIGSKQEHKSNGERLQSWHLAVHGAKEDDDISDEPKEKVRYQCCYLKIAFWMSSTDTSLAW